MENPAMLILAEDGQWETPSWARTNDDDQWISYGWKAWTYEGHVFHYHKEQSNVRQWLTANGYQNTGDGKHYQRIAEERQGVDMDTIEGTLVLSSNRGRYAIGDPTYGPDLSSGRSVEVCVGGQWLPGHVEYNHDPIYVQLGAQTLGEVSQMATRPKAIAGYYVTLNDGEIIGLCVGMRVRAL